MGTSPSGDSAGVHHLAPSSASTVAMSFALVAVSRSSTSAEDKAAMSSTIRSGETAGSKSVGSPASPATADITYRGLIPATWAMTSRTDHRLHRLGADHSASVKVAAISANRTRWRISGAATSRGSPSIVTTGDLCSVARVSIF